MKVASIEFGTVDGGVVIQLMDYDGMAVGHTVIEYDDGEINKIDSLDMLSKYVFLNLNKKLRTEEMKNSKKKGVKKV